MVLAPETAAESEHRRGEKKGDQMMGDQRSEKSEKAMPEKSENQERKEKKENQENKDYSGVSFQELSLIHI